MASKIVTLTTDFGFSDHYVGVMKGVIAGLNPDAKLIDICHEVRAYDVAQGAFFVAQSYPYFPAGTVHVVVVDPGVGTKRRPLLMEAAEQYFIAPDNGVLSQVCERESHVVRVIDADRHALKPTSLTFHGRDIFAPVAARLSKGTPSEEFGEVIHDCVRLPATSPVSTAAGCWRGRILNIDRFGNLVTSFRPEVLPQPPAGFRLVAGSLETRSSAAAYAQGPEGEPFVIVGSSGYLELSIRQASAAEIARVSIGDPVELVLLDSGPFQFRR